MKNPTKKLLFGCGLSLVLASPTFAQALPEPPDPQVQWEDYGRDANPGQMLELTMGKDAKSHYIEVAGHLDEDQPVLLAISAAKAEARFPWGDVLLVDPAQIAVILTVTPCLHIEPLSECGKVRFRAGDLGLLPGEAVRFYMQAFAADMGGSFPFLTSAGLQVTIENTH